MRRRDFLTLIGGAATWSVDARAQRVGGMPRVGALLGWSEGVPEYRAWFDRVTAPPPPQPAAETPPDYRVIVDYLDKTQLRKLESPGSGYHLQATFHYRHPLGLDIPFTFLNPTVYVFKRVR